MTRPRQPSPPLLTPRPRGRRGPRLLWPGLVLLALLAANAVRFDDGRPTLSAQFFSLELKDADPAAGLVHTLTHGRLYGNLVDLFNRAAPIMLVALGMTLVIATGGIDLSVGAVMAVAGALAIQLLGPPGCSVPAAILIALAAGLLAGAWNGFLVAVLGVQPIVATLVLMVAGRGVAQLITGGQILTTTDAAFAALGGGYILLLPVAVLIALGLFLLTALLTRGTALGLFIESIGDNRTASRYAGVRVRSVTLAAYAFSGLCAALAGLIIAANIKAADANNAGLYLELDAILAAVIGGTALTGGRFTLRGAVLGALIIQLLNLTILRWPVPAEFNQVVKAIVVLAVCLLQSESLRALLWRRRSA
jgi:ribose/xylose/arabinose/galactoside ABC-type transport system permease subunit